MSTDRFRAVTFARFSNAASFAQTGHQPSQIGFDGNSATTAEILSRETGSDGKTIWVRSIRDMTTITDKAAYAKILA